MYTSACRIARDNIMTAYLTAELTTKDINRIFSKIDIDPDDPLGKCWIWKGARTWSKHGVVWFHGKQEGIHRLVYAWLIKPILKGLSAEIPVLDHICDNPPCCNPFHLRLVTNCENLARTGSVSAINRRKTHCIHGHLLPAEPNRTDGSGRFCPICRKEQGAEYYQKIGKSKQRATRDKNKPPTYPKPILTEEEHRQKNREYYRDYRNRNRDARNEYMREWRKRKKVNP